jgi:hypothetical protein
MHIVDLTQPKGKYGDTFQGIANILDTIGKVERLRQDRALNSKIINLVSQGMGTPENIAQALTEAQPQYSSGAVGFLQEIANQFAPPSMIESQMGQMGIASAFQPEKVGAMPWAATQMTPEQKKNWLENYGRGVTIQTGEKLLTPAQRQERAETEFREKVGLSPSEKNLARKSAEEILKGTKARWWSYDLPGKTIPDYTQEMMFENYKTWQAENSYDEQTPRKKKELDDLWDAKMGLWQKSGVKFDKDNIIGKNEIVWDPTDPEVRKLRGAEQKGIPPEQITPPTGRNIIGTLEGTPAQKKAIEAIVGKALSTEQKQTLIEQILRNDRIRVKDISGKIGTVPADKLADWLAVGGNTLEVEDRRK